MGQRQTRSARGARICCSQTRPPPPFHSCAPGPALALAKLPGTFAGRPRARGRASSAGARGRRALAAFACAARGRGWERAPAGSGVGRLRLGGAGGRVGEPGVRLPDTPNASCWGGGSQREEGGSAPSRPQWPLACGEAGPAPRRTCKVGTTSLEPRTW